MKLIPIFERPDYAQILWALLAEREPHVNISHKEMPTWDEHKRFVEGRPYYDWRFIEVDGVIVGSVYLTYGVELGIHLFKVNQGLGYGPRAIQSMMQVNGLNRRYLANVAPGNEASKRMWEKLGFTKIQETFALDNRESFSSGFWPREKISVAEALKRWPST